MYYVRSTSKSNEITAIPDVLKSWDIEDSVVSIDAVGTQTAIAKQIRDQRGHYLLSVKGNQQELFEDVQCAFKTHRGYDFMKETDCDHGRILVLRTKYTVETRRYSILPAKDFFLTSTLSFWCFCN